MNLSNPNISSQPHLEEKNLFWKCKQLKFTLETDMAYAASRVLLPQGFCCDFSGCATMSDTDRQGRAQAQAGSLALGPVRLPQVLGDMLQQLNFYRMSSWRKQMVPNRFSSSIFKNKVTKSNKNYVQRLCYKGWFLFTSKFTLFFLCPVSTSGPSVTPTPPTSRPPPVTDPSDANSSWAQTVVSSRGGKELIHQAALNDTEKRPWTWLRKEITWLNNTSLITHQHTSKYFFFFSTNLH